MKPGLAEALCQWCEDLDYWRWKNFSPNFCSVLLSLFDAKQTQKHLTKNKRWIRVGGVRWVRRGVWIVSVSFIWFLYINVKCVCVYRRNRLPNWRQRTSEWHWRRSRRLRWRRWVLSHIHRHREGWWVLFSHIYACVCNFVHVCERLARGRVFLGQVSVTLQSSGQ